MPIQDFFHEVAFNQMNAGRGQFTPPAPWWQRVWRKLSAAERRVLAVFAVVLVAIAGYVFRQPLAAHLRSQPAHPPGAADTLTFSNHRAPPHEIVHRLAVACAREDDPAGCEDALKTLLKLTDPATVTKALAVPEIKALRANDYFDRFARELETRTAGAPAPARIVPSAGAMP